MRKISDYVFNISPKKLAVYLVLAPLILFFLYTVVTIVFKTISGIAPDNKIVVTVLLGILLLFLAILVLLWLFWLRSTVFSVSVADLGLPRKWFDLALLLFIAYLLYNLCHPLIENLRENYRGIFYALNEFLAFGGLIIAYPLICHYAARAAMAERSGKPATFVNTIPFTLLLIFGTVLGLPFLHKYFSQKTSTNSEIMVIYAFAFGLFIFIMIMGFIAAITGLV